MPLFHDAFEEDADLDSIEEALKEIRNGRAVIVVDARDRENEGDFICSAELITPELVNFMLRQGGGMLCVPMVEEVSRRLQLGLAAGADTNTTPHQTNFLVQVDHLTAGTGVSAENRARTIKALADPHSNAEDFMRPGHISPLLAKDGGVLRRAGHTEATIDLMRLAGLRPVGALIEILSPTGSGMATLDELKGLARQFGLKIISISSLIRYRRQREQLVKRIVEVPIKTRDYGTPMFIAYKVEHEEQEPLAIVWGDLLATEAPLVRMHSSCFTGDILGSLRCDCGDQLHMAMAMIHKEGAGAVVYLPQEGRGIGLTAKLQAYQLQDQGFDTVEANIKLGYKADLRDFMVGLQILKDLGLKQIRLLTNNPKKTEAFEEWVDLKVVEQLPIIAEPDEHRERYLATKRDKMGHKLPVVLLQNETRPLE
ncbi:MAG: GTP cyclohydrolase II [Planctomycetaceae bacterium]|nr:GTP cyclohydrolase II [Planctomycetaceae bacterium]